MNPFPPYQFTQPRDKTKSYFQPHTMNPFSATQPFHQQNQSPIYQSDKYKSYYTEYQDYRSVGEQDNNNSTFRAGEQQRASQFFEQRANHNATQPNGFFHNNSHNPNNSNRPTQPHHPSTRPSQQRKRFYTVTSQYQRTNNVSNHYPASTTSFTSPSLQQPHYSSSMIFTTRPSSTLDKQPQPLITTNPKKDLYKFVNQKFAASRVESCVGSREKQRESRSSNKAEYLDKANKKVSLKRDIAPINSPKYQEQGQGQGHGQSHGQGSMPPLLPNAEFANIRNKLKSTKSQPREQTNPPFSDPSLPKKTLTDIYHKPFQLQSQNNKTTDNDLMFPSTFEKSTKYLQTNNQQSVGKNSQNNYNEEKQRSLFKRSSKGSVVTYEAEKNSATTPSNQSTSTKNNNKTTPTNNNTNSEGIGSQRQQYFSSTRPNQPTSSKPSPPSTTPAIDAQVYTDMKISRIQESTSHLQQQLLILTTTLHLLTQQSKQHQTSLTHLHSYITKQQEQGMTPHDIKRIKKQLKIMKTNFETAFTSMTEQINRKLVKEENIMKSLSEEIRLVAEENQRLTVGVQSRDRKVDGLEKSVVSFMRENEERMESLVLNDSFSSSRKSKNHSFEYGLDLKNMSSGDDHNNYASLNSGRYPANQRQQQSPQQLETNNLLTKKIDNLQKQIKKMKVFHIEEQESYLARFVEVKREIEKVEKSLGVKIDEEKLEIQECVKDTVEGMLTTRLDNWSMVYDDKQQQLLQTHSQQLQSIRLHINELNKVCHQELYEFRMNKLQTITPQSLASENLIVKSEFEQHLSELQSKQRGLLVTLTEYQQKLVSVEDRQHTVMRNLEDHRLKELKLVGDVREVQQSLKQLNKQLTLMTNTTLPHYSTSIKQHSTTLTSLTTHLSTLQTRITQIDRINNIQTQNIESINSEFERVINKEIIPKFAEIHQANLEVGRGLQVVGEEVKGVKVRVEVGGGGSIGGNGGFGSRQLQQKIEQYLTTHLPRLTPTHPKVHLISTKLLSSKSPLTKIGLFPPPQPSNPFHQPTLFPTDTITKEDTYLLDEDGYLMDWEGAYLMELDQFGARRKVRISEQEVYFMQVNGLEVGRVGRDREKNRG